MNNISPNIGILIIGLFLFFVLRWAYTLGGDRNIDDELPWLRVGSRWRAHHILPFFVFFPFVAWIEGWVLNDDPWPNFGTVSPVFEVAAPPPRPQPTKEVPHFPVRPEGMSNAAYSQMILELGMIRAGVTWRGLESILTDVERKTLGDIPSVIFPSDTGQIDIFAVREAQTALDENIARGWLARQMTGYDAAQYEVVTRCGFDVTVTPIQRVCFSAIPAAIFLKGTHGDCLPGVIETEWQDVDSNSTSTPTKIRKTKTRDCTFTITLPWALLRMDASGVTVTACVFDTLQRRLEPCDNGSLKLSLAGADEGGTLAWQNYGPDGETLAMELAPNPGFEEGPTAITHWSSRHITQGHESVLEMLRPVPEPVETITKIVPLPASHLAAMRFIDADHPAAQGARASRATLYAKQTALMRQIGSHAVRAAYDNDKCVKVLAKKSGTVDLIVVPYIEPDEANPVRIAAASGSAPEPRTVRVGGALCPSILPVLLRDLY